MNEENPDRIVYDKRPPEPIPLEKESDTDSYLAVVQRVDPAITNMVCFDHAVCVVLRELFINFPGMVSLETELLIRHESIPDACRAGMGPDFQCGRQNLISGAIDFLVREGFIVVSRWQPRSVAYDGATLTMRGLSVLRSTPTSLDLPGGTAPLGEQLAKDFASASATALVSTILAAFIAAR